MKRYSGSTSPQSSGPMGAQGGGNGWYVLAGLGVLAFMFFGGSGEGGFDLRAIQQTYMQNRVLDATDQMESDRKTQAFEKSAQRALVLSEKYECVTIVNTNNNQLGLEAGAVHVAITPEMVVTDPVTGAPLARDTCIRDHLGNFALLMDGGVVGEIAHNPNLALAGANEFTRETSKSVGDTQ